MRILGCFVLVLACMPSLAQTPQHALSENAQGLGFGIHETNAITQSIYYPGEFPQAHAGEITALYFRSYGNPSGISATFYDLKVKIGYTADSGFIPSTIYAPSPDSFRSQLTTILSAASYTLPGSEIDSQWVKIPLPPGTFSFDPSRNFIVEIS